MVLADVPRKVGAHSPLAVADFRIVDSIRAKDVDQAQYLCSVSSAEAGEGRVPKAMLNALPHAIWRVCKGSRAQEKLPPVVIRYVEGDSAHRLKLGHRC